jgi:hypothetical protein
MAQNLAGTNILFIKPLAFEQLRGIKEKRPRKYRVC